MKLNMICFVKKYLRVTKRTFCYTVWHPYRSRAILYLSLKLKRLHTFWQKSAMNKTTAVNISRDNRSGLSGNIPSKAESIVWCCVFVLASAMIVIENILTIVLFVGNKKLRKKSLFLIINMAVADLMLGALSLPFYIYEIGEVGYHLWRRSTDIYLAYIGGIADNVPTVASLVSATSISCERFYALHWPFKQRSLSERAYFVIILMLWTISALDTALFFLLGSLRFIQHYFYYWLSFKVRYQLLSYVVVTSPYGGNFDAELSLEHNIKIGTYKKSVWRRLCCLFLFLPCFLGFHILFQTP